MYSYIHTWKIQLPDSVMSRCTCTRTHTGIQAHAHTHTHDMWGTSHVCIHIYIHTHLENLTTQSSYSYIYTYIPANPNRQRVLFVLYSIHMESPTAQVLYSYIHTEIPRHPNYPKIFIIYTYRQQSKGIIDINIQTCLETLWAVGLGSWFSRYACMSNCPRVFCPPAYKNSLESTNK